MASTKADEVAAAAVAKKEKKEKKEKKDKKDKKEKKEKKRSETDGVHKHKDKSDKKEKKQKKEKLAQALEAHLAAEDSTASSTASAAPAEDKSMADASSAPAAKAPRAAKPIVRGAVVEFAKPLATDKYQKKVFKMVRRAAKQQALLRGVKEVNKALRKAPAKNPSAPANSATTVPGIVVIAGDISPAEVVMHLPLACEDVSAPYVFVASRGELGQAARTKRPTSVVMIKAEGRTKKAGTGAAAKPIAEDEDEDDEDDGSSYGEQFQEFVQVVQKEYTKQMKGII